MRRLLWPALALVLLTTLAHTQDPDIPSEPQKLPTVIPELQKAITVPANPEIAAGTKVWLRLANEVKVKKVKIGDPVNFVLSRDLYYRNWLLARAGTPVAANIQEVKKAKVMNRGSHLRIVFEELKLVNGQRLPLSGETAAHGGAGTGGQIASGLLDIASQCNAWPCLIFDVPAVPTALILGATTKGENRNVRINTSAPAYVDGDFAIDVASLRQIEQGSPATGKLTIVGSNIGWLYTRYIYCNGTPLAEIKNNRRLELDLAPGYYRFSVLAKWPLEVFVNPGTTTNLMAGVAEVVELDEQAVLPSRKSGGELLARSKPVDAKDILGKECAPLAEVIVP